MTFVQGNLCGHAGLKTAEPYTGYGDGTRGAYKALIPTQIYGRSVEKLYATPLDLSEDSNEITANIYYKGTANSGVAYVFAFFPKNNSDAGKVEKIVSCSDLTEGWNTVTLEVELDTLGAFYIYTMTNDKITDLALGAVYTEVPAGTAVAPEGVGSTEEDKDETIYILQAIDGQEAAPYTYNKKFDATMNGYGDGKRGAYVSGSLGSGDWVAAKFAAVDLSKAKFAAVNLYVDNPDEFTVATIELSSFSYDQQERNWTITSNNVKLKKGWNVIYLDLNNAAGKSAKGTIGYTATDVGGAYDSSAVSFMRMYGTYGGEKTALGAIYVVNSIGGVQTGDATNIVLIVGALMLACAAAATATFCGKKARAN